jgi:hypothetical protein
MKAWLIPITLSLFTGTARADQCAWIEGAVAQKAQTLLTSAPKFIEFCEPCGDKAPGVPQRVQGVDLHAADGALFELTLNGKPIDLAYTFVKTDDTHYKNLAALAGCPATGVSRQLTIEPETTNGVLIMPSTEPPPPVTAVTAVTTLPAPAPPAPPPQVYIYTTTTHEIAWLAVMLAAGGGFVTGAALTLALVTIRRRRAMRPRAMDIAAR